MKWIRRELASRSRRLRGASPSFLWVAALLVLLGGGGPRSRALGAPSVFPTGVTLHDPTKAFQGYNLFVDETRGGPLVGTIVLMDMDGNEVQTWLSPLAGATAVKHTEPLANGNLLTMVLNPSTGDKTLVEMDWSGALVWQYAPPPGEVLHHDFERLASGNTLILLRRQITEPSIGPNVFNDEVVQEVDASGQIVWEWSTAEHYDTLPFSDVERSYIWLASLQKKRNLFHANAVSSLPPNPHETHDPRFAAGNILMSQRDTSTVLLIERSTGDMVWFTKMALGQHQPHMLDLSLPGAGNILMLDNGGEAGYPTRSRLWSQVLEIDPPTGETLWSYDATAGGLRTAEAFFGPFQGGAQRLPNGNTLVTEATWGRAFEVDPAGVIVWEYVSSRDIQIYRMVRVDPTWPQIGPGRRWRDRGAPRR